MKKAAEESIARINRGVTGFLKVAVANPKLKKYEMYQQARPSLVQIYHRCGEAENQRGKLDKSEVRESNLQFEMVLQGSQHNRLDPSLIICQLIGKYFAFDSTILLLPQPTVKMQLILATFNISQPHKHNFSHTFSHCTTRYRLERILKNRFV